MLHKQPCVSPRIQWSIHSKTACFTRLRLKRKVEYFTTFLHPHKELYNLQLLVFMWLGFVHSKFQSETCNHITWKHMQLWHSHSMWGFLPDVIYDTRYCLFWKMIIRHRDFENLTLDQKKVWKVDTHGSSEKIDIGQLWKNPPLVEPFTLYH